MAIVVSSHVDDRTPHVLLARHTFHGGRWGVPSGWVRRREHPAAASVREVAEETGLAVRATDLLGCELHAVEGVAVRYGGISIAYRCEPVERADPDPQPRSFEIGEVRWVAAAEATALLTGFEQAMIDNALTLVPRPMSH
jgi:8-oxo-dGTP pyrophosphatase MutT (NUDIX family)